jgi:hypothetical protein
MATGYGLDDRGSNPDRGKVFLFSTTPRPFLVFTQPPIQWVPRAISLGVERPCREANHLSPSSVEMQNGGAILPLFLFLMFAACCVSYLLILIHRQRNHNLLTFVHLHVSTIIRSSSGVVIYTFPLLYCEAYIRVYIHRLKMITFYVHLYFNL